MVYHNYRQITSYNEKKLISFYTYLVEISMLLIIIEQLIDYLITK